MRRHVRASFRDSLESPSPIQPGEAYKYRVDVGPTAMLFRKGHRIRLEVSSSNFPAYARNGRPITQVGERCPGHADRPARRESPVTSNAAGGKEIA